MGMTVELPQESLGNWATQHRTDLFFAVTKQCEIDPDEAVTCVEGGLERWKFLGQVEVSHPSSLLPGSIGCGANFSAEAGEALGSTMGQELANHDDSWINLIYVEYLWNICGLWEYLWNVYIISME